IMAAAASTYCSRKVASPLNAVRKGRSPRFCTYQLGRGSEPVMVVARGREAVATNTVDLLICGWHSKRQRSEAMAPDHRLIECGSQSAMAGNNTSKTSLIRSATTNGATPL